jgi:hypothetical protein
MLTNFVVKLYFYVLQKFCKGIAVTKTTGNIEENGIIGEDIC